MTQPQRTFIITGASSGIGAELAELAAARGYAVLAVARRADRLAQLAARIGAKQGRFATLTADVCDPASPRRIVDTAMQAFGRIDILVNNAGVGAAGALLAQSDTAIDAQWQLHVGAPLRITRATLAQLREHRGGVVFVGSGLARVPAPNFGAYCAAKAAVRAAAQQLRRELRADGIAVTYVDPGAVATEFLPASGLQAAPGGWHVAPKRVAQTMLRGIERRAAHVNALPLQTFGVMLAEWFPALGDAAMARMVAHPAPEPRVSDPVDHVETIAGADTPDAFAAALAPVAHRMERVKLSVGFVRTLLVPEAQLELGDVAMQWAGMPNKNERAVTADVLGALAQSGFLTPIATDVWRVNRGP